MKNVNQVLEYMDDEPEPPPETLLSWSLAWPQMRERVIRANPLALPVLLFDRGLPWRDALEFGRSLADGTNN